MGYAQQSCFFLIATGICDSPIDYVRKHTFQLRILVIKEQRALVSVIQPHDLSHDTLVHIIRVELLADGFEASKVLWVIVSNKVI